MDLLIPRGTSHLRVAALMQAPAFRELQRQLDAIAEKYGFKDQVQRKGRKVSTRKAVARIHLAQSRRDKRSERAAARNEMRRDAAADASRRT